LIRALSSLAPVAYLILAHLASLFADARLALLAVGLLVASLLGPALLRGRVWAWLAIGLTGAALAWLGTRELGMLPLYAPPILFNLLFAYVFGRTLVPGSQPLIERIARLMENRAVAIDADIAHYARRLTGAWTLLFLMLALLSFLLALFAKPHGLLLSAGVDPAFTVPHATWSWVANVFNYLVVGGFFIAEYFWRRHRFADLPYRSFAEFFRGMQRVPVSAWRELAR